MRTPTGRASRLQARSSPHSRARVSRLGPLRNPTGPVGFPCSRMAQRIPVGIAGTGSYVPERIVPNAFFEKLVDTSDEWIVQRSGLEQRRFAAVDQATSDLSVEAAKRALEAAGVR